MNSSERSHPNLRRPCMARVQRRDRGFTILEVAMAAFIMALVIATSITALQSGFKTLDVARGTTLASQIAQSEIERLRLLSWGAITALPSSTTIDLSAVFTTDPTVAGRFTAMRTVSDYTINGVSGQMKEITIDVTWTSYDGRSHTRTFRTHYALNGLYDYYYTVARS